MTIPDPFDSGDSLEEDEFADGYEEDDDPDDDFEDWEEDDDDFEDDEEDAFFGYEEDDE